MSACAQAPEGMDETDIKRGEELIEEWTPELVERIREISEPVDERYYRFQVPVFKRGKVIDTKIIGALPVTEIHRVARYRDVRYVEDANAQSVIWTDSDQSGGPPPGIGGCSSDHSTPARGHDLGNRIREVLEGLDESQYFYLN
ncbi:MAG: hypothetical protein AAF449_09865 [Myxococcota bacterium]